LSISSIVLSQLSFYGWRPSFAWKVYSLKKVLKCQDNSFVDIDSSKRVGKNRMQNKIVLIRQWGQWHLPFPDKSAQDKSFCCEGPGH
jgi:hypothetical protein